MAYDARDEPCTEALRLQVEADVHFGVRHLGLVMTLADTAPTLVVLDVARLVQAFRHSSKPSPLIVLLTICAIGLQEGGANNHPRCRVLRATPRTQYAL